jgi:hypothetical protein
MKDHKYYKYVDPYSYWSAVGFGSYWLYVAAFVLSIVNIILWIYEGNVILYMLFVFLSISSGAHLHAREMRERYINMYGEPKEVVDE